MRMQIIHPNAMSFSETKTLLNDGVLHMVVDRSLAIVGVRSGIPISSAGKLANVLMIALPAVGLILALTVVWWWFLVGLAAGFGNFQVARAECVRAVRIEALRHERLFELLRKNGTIRFEFAST